MEEDAQQFDLEGVVAGYSGTNRLYRLLFIAEKKAGQPVELDALRLAHDEVKQTENLDAYTRIIERIAGRLGPAYTHDRAWFNSTEQHVQRKQERLESELAGYKANLIKESIRMGHHDLGDHFYACGDMANAFKCYIRARDYATSSRHVVAMCLKAITVAALMRNYVSVGSYAAKAENTPEAQVDPVVMAKVAACTGLSLLASKRYKQAARKLLEVSPDLGATFTDVLTLQDVALYGVLCALASLDRDEVQRRLLRSLGFKEVMDAAPEVRDIVHDFHACRYARALSALDRLAPTLLLDPHLEPHGQALLHQIRQRALIQYTSPFTSVRLSTMAQAFNTTAGELGTELAALVLDGAIPARIDAQAGVLHAHHTDARATTFAKTLAFAQLYVRETKAALLRVDLLSHDFGLKPRGAGRSGGGAGGSGGGGGGGGGIGGLGLGHWPVPRGPIDVAPGPSGSSRHGRQGGPRGGARGAAGAEGSQRVVLDPMPGAAANLALHLDGAAGEDDEEAWMMEIAGSAPGPSSSGATH